HSQMVRTLRFESERYGHYSLAGESVYDRPFQWGSKRTGPDLARVGGRYSDDWHRVHLIDPRAVVPESNMPSFPWLAEARVDPAKIERNMRNLQRLGDPYTDEDLAGVAAAVEGKTELDAVVAYLQGLGRHAPTAAAAAAAASDAEAPQRPAESAPCSCCCCSSAAGRSSGGLRTRPCSTQPPGCPLRTRPRSRGNEHRLEHFRHRAGGAEPGGPVGPAELDQPPPPGRSQARGHQPRLGW